MVKIVNGEIVPDGAPSSATNNDSILPTSLTESNENMNSYFGSPIRLCGKSISRGMLYGILFFMLIFFLFKMVFLVVVGLGIAYYMENRDTSTSNNGYSAVSTNDRNISSGSRLNTIHSTGSTGGGNSTGKKSGGGGGPNIKGIGDYPKPKKS